MDIDSPPYGALVESLTPTHFVLTEAVVEMHKANGSVPWLERPLSPRLMQYATNDIYVIDQLYNAFLQKLMQSRSSGSCIPSRSLNRLRSRLAERWIGQERSLRIN